MVTPESLKALGRDMLNAQAAYRFALELADAAHKRASAAQDEATEASQRYWAAAGEYAK